MQDNDDVQTIRVGHSPDPDDAFMFMPLQQAHLRLLDISLSMCC